MYNISPIQSLYSQNQNLSSGLVTSPHNLESLLINLSTSSFFSLHSILHIVTRDSAKKTIMTTSHPYIKLHWLPSSSMIQYKLLCLAFKDLHYMVHNLSFHPHWPLFPLPRSLIQPNQTSFVDNYSDKNKTKQNRF